MNSATTLLERAVSYATRSVLDVTPASLQHPTPCHGWNLGMLLRHTAQSLATLNDATATGHVALIPEPEHVLSDPVQDFTSQAGRLLAARAVSRPRRELEIGGLTLPGITAECAGAIEITVHGWDISQACGQDRPIPDSLAASLLAVAPLLIPRISRPPCSPRRSRPAPAPASASSSSPISAANPPYLARPQPEPAAWVLTGNWARHGLRIPSNAMIWVALPLAIGAIRTLRRDVS